MNDLIIQIIGYGLTFIFLIIVAIDAIIKMNDLHKYDNAYDDIMNYPKHYLEKKERIFKITHTTF